MTIASTALTHAVGHGAPADLPMWRRLNLIRIGYAVMGVGLAVVKWLAFLGLRYPVRLLPILVFATLWKRSGCPWWPCPRSWPARWIGP